MSAPQVPAQVPAHQTNGSVGAGSVGRSTETDPDRQAQDREHNRDKDLGANPDQTAAPLRFPPREEAALLDESNNLKSQANTLFSQTSYSQAISEYDKALSSCPTYLEYEVAVLQSNIAACHLRLQDWQAAIDAATAALDALERLLPSPKPALNSKATKTSAKGEEVGHDDDEENEIVEIAEEGGEEAEKAQLAALELNDQRKLDAKKLRAKSLMRRAKAKQSLGGWSNLQGAEDDYKAVLSLSSPFAPFSPSSTSPTVGPGSKTKLILPPQDRKMVDTALRTLPAQIQSAREKEMGEMWGKLKELGNGILKPFGLSTNNFQMVQDEKTGGYSMNFTQGSS